MKVFIFFSICIAVAVCVRKPTRDERKILRNESKPPGLIGGRPAKQSSDKKYFEFPWMVSLHFKGKFRCSSFLITPKVVMTAGHCVVKFSDDKPADPKDFTAYMGTVKRDGPDNEVKFTELILHEKYGDHLNYDIAIMKLVKPVVLRYNIQPICLPTKDSFYENTTAQAMGWGSTGSRYRDSNTLQTATEKIVTNSMCKSAYDKLYASSSDDSFITQSHICVGGTGKTGLCFGDSGGPLVALNETKPVAIGIFSFLPNRCAYQGVPDVYTATAMYTDWILENMGEDANDLCFVNKTSRSTI